MKKVVDDPRLMIKVCDLYYNQDASQQQIGKQLGLSRPTVARLLASAREQQIVEIMDRLEIEIPRQLNVEEQAVFMLGYYHQVQKRYEKKEEDAV